MAQKPSKRKPKTIVHATAHKMLSRAGIALFGILIVASFAFTAAIATPGFLSTQMAAVVTSRLVSLTNDDRSDNGLGTLTTNPALTAAAQAKADDMAAKGYFAHVSPDGRDSWTWFKDAGYSFSYAGENLAVDFTDSTDVNTAWLNSPTHRANIMNGHFTEIGIATAEGEFEGHKTVFVVQMFGTPAATAAPTKVVTVASPQNANEPALATAQPDDDVLGASAGPTEKQNAVADAAPITGVSATSAKVPSATPTAVAVASTETPIPAQTNVVAQTNTPLSTVVGSPHTLLRNLYLLFAILLILALAVRTRLEFKLHHTRHVFAVLFLVVLMGGFFVISDHYVFVAPIIGQGVAQ